MGKSHLIETEKFYLFDIGVAHYLAGRVPVPHTFEFGKAFEHYIFMALKAYQAYRYPELMLYYWRTSTNREVDFILGDMEAAIEIKNVKSAYMKRIVKTYKYSLKKIL
ncbi:MAG: DUF4143 domain-containing protein [Gammaproteobacteria bacterium]|nr:DUF4143 domain-containing protein [Gammaproteobacteria bacterium]